MLKVAIVSTSDIDGGAAKAAFRLLMSLVVLEVEARMFVQVKTSQEPRVVGPSYGLAKQIGRVRPHIDQWPAELIGARMGEFSLNWLSGGLQRRLAAFRPDVVHLHGIHAGSNSVVEIGKLDYPVVWTAHDMWPFTGGCHYDRGCQRYKTLACHPCPVAPRLTSLHVPRQRLHSKQAAARRAGVIFVSPSRWLAEVAKDSPVTIDREIVVIPNGLDLDLFKPIDKLAARDLFGLPHDKTILLFGAVNSTSDERKGFAYLEEALGHFAAAGLADDLVLCAFGTPTRDVSERHGVRFLSVGHLKDEESLVALYSAADLFVAPSLQDNLPNTVLEATACGLPCVAFNIGGMPDLIADGETGFLAEEMSGSALFEAARKALFTEGWLARASSAARRHAERHFSAPDAAASHLTIYHRAVKQRAGRFNE